MRFCCKFIILILTTSFLACAGEEKPDTPLETLRAYTLAIKQKDTTTMKLLLSDASIKMAEAEAKSRNVTLDEVVRRETLFDQTQRTVEFRNEKIDGDTSFEYRRRRNPPPLCRCLPRTFRYIVCSEAPRAVPTDGICQKRPVARLA